MGGCLNSFVTLYLSCHLLKQDYIEMKIYEKIVNNMTTCWFSSDLSSDFNLNLGQKLLSWINLVMRDDAICKI